MNDLDLKKASQLFNMLVGEPTEDLRFVQLASATSRYEEFRIRLFVDTELLAMSVPVVATWQEFVDQPAKAPDANSLMHAIEQLTLRQFEVERQLRERDADLLDNLRQMDKLVASFAALQQESTEIRLVLAHFRDAIMCLARPGAALDGESHAQQE